MEFLIFWVLFTLLVLHTLLNFVVTVALITGYLVLKPIRGVLLFVMFTLSTVFFWFALFTSFPLSIGN